jgi:hypothetical protein
MKISAAVAALLGTSSASNVKMSSMQAKCSEMDAKCNASALADIDASNLLQIQDDGVGTHVDNTKEGDEAHYGKETHVINAENKHILDTQKECLDFVGKHQDHP